jgi:hypothetical protein
VRYAPETRLTIAPFSIRRESTKPAKTRHLDSVTWLDGNLTFVRPDPLRSEFGSGMRITCLAKMELLGPYSPPDIDPADNALVLTWFFEYDRHGPISSDRLV